MASSRVLCVSAAVGVAMAEDGFLAARPSNSKVGGLSSTGHGERMMHFPLDFGSPFELRYGGQQNTCVDVAGGRGDNFNKLQVYECAYPENQMFIYNPDDEMPQIKWNKDPSKCLDVKDGVTSNFADIVLYDCHPLDHPDRPHQAFVFDSSYTGFGQIKWQPHPEKCIDLNDGIVGSSSEQNSKLITYDCHNYGNEDFIHQQFAVYNPETQTACEVQENEESCSSTPSCEWCGRSILSCYNKELEPDACAN